MSPRPRLERRMVLSLACAAVLGLACGGGGGSANQPSLDNSGTWTGTWQSSQYGVSGSFTARITQTGSALSGSITVPEIGMSGATLQGTSQGTAITFGDIEGRITFTGTVNGGSASGTYTYPSFSDHGAWQGTNTPSAGTCAPGAACAFDVLFVVDDSGSMRPEQARLAASFSAFVDVVADAQQRRAQGGLDPFEVHVAVTTSAVFEAWELSPAAPDHPTCGGAPLQCVIPQEQTWYQVQQDVSTCTDAGGACNDLNRYYAFPSVALPSCPFPGVATGLAAYPAGDFVALGQNPRVLHLTRELEWASWDPANPALAPNLAALVQQFEGNVAVGTCGSGMEQPFEAARLALTKAQAGSQPVIQDSEFLHPGAKLVVVFVSDEDDCSSPNDATRALAFSPSSITPGSDVCTQEQSKPVDQQKLLRVADYADFLTGLGRPVGAAFVYSARLGADGRCQPDGHGGCTPGACDCQCPSHCAVCDSNQSDDCWTPGHDDPVPCRGNIGLAESRFHQLSAALRERGANTLEASVCEADWSGTMQGIARDLILTP